MSFGWLLLAQGAACAPDAAMRTRAAYLACFGLVVVYAALRW